MSPLQWLFVIGAGVAGYFGVSWLIERGKRAPTDAVAAPPQHSAEPPAAPTEPSAAPPAPGGGERSAWDEFNKR